MHDEYTPFFHLTSSGSLCVGLRIHPASQSAFVESLFIIDRSLPSGGGNAPTP